MFLTNEFQKKVKESETQTDNVETIQRENIVDNQESESTDYATL